MTTNQSPLMSASNDDPGKLIWIVGLAAIGRYMGWSALKVLRMNQKQGFPLMRLPNVQGQWSYATTTLMVQLWCNAMAEEAYDLVAKTALGQSLRRTRGPAAPPATPDASTTDGAPPLDGAIGGGVKPGEG